MAATTLQRLPMQNLIHKINKRVPSITFQSGDAFYWSPKKSLIMYQEKALLDDNGKWALLHEAGHAELDHTSYDSDFELLIMEVAAWEKAREIGKSVGIIIPDTHIQDCLDTYRDWLHERSTCPTCSTVSFQQSAIRYKCHNCPATWQVSTSRFCRPYRLSVFSRIEKSSELNAQTTFQ